MNAIVRYEEMRLAVQACATIDEAKQIQDKAEALKLYARQRDDQELEVWMAEIRLRASIRIGELVAELESQQGARTDLEPSLSTARKSDAIKDAGLTEPTAYRYQQLAGGVKANAQAAGVAAAEGYFARARVTQEPATMGGLRAAIRQALDATMPPRPEPATPASPVVPPLKVGADYIDWTSAVEHLAHARIDLAAVAEFFPHGRQTDVRNARAALGRLQQWIEARESRT